MSVEIIAEPVGRNRGKWKGGVIKREGYVYLYSPYHPQENAWGKGYVKRARLIMEDYLGRILDRDEFVHHKNEIRDDDRLENLEIRNLSEHQKFHQPKTVAGMRRDSLGRFLPKEVVLDAQ